MQPKIWKKNLKDRSVEARRRKARRWWLRASLADLVDFDFEAPIRESQSADSNELSLLFRNAAESVATDASPETPAAHIFSILAAVTGMHLKSQEPSEPFGAMVVWAGRRLRKIFVGTR